VRSKRRFIGLRAALAIFAVTVLVMGTAHAQETVLHSFSVKDGNYPGGSLIFDAAGNLYGTTSAGGVHGLGTVFEITP